MEVFCLEDGIDLSIGLLSDSLGCRENKPMIYSLDI
jgi:hypothetical protein